MATAWNENGNGNGKTSWVAGLVSALLAMALGTLILWTFGQVWTNGLEIVKIQQHEILQDNRIDNLNERLKQLELWQFKARQPPS